MAEAKEFTCIECPRGCRLVIELDIVAKGSAKVDGIKYLQATVTGNACPKGEAYGKQEAINPMRSLTTTVVVEGSARRRLPVRTDGDLPLSRLLEAMAAIDPVVVHPSVVRGDVVVRDLLGLGINLIATDDLTADVNLNAGASR